jgi:type II secretory pathway pseudopilin PulG
VRRTGIALVEAGIVVVILGVLALILVPHVHNSSQNVKLNRSTFRLQTIRTAIEKYKAVEGSAPENLDRLLHCKDNGGSPLLAEISVEAISRQPSVVVVDYEGRLSLPQQKRQGGWIYNRRTGEIRINLKAHEDL